MYPSFTQFSRWATQYTAIPLWIEPELPDSDLTEWVHSHNAHQSQFFFFHSASQGPQARYSYIALDSPRFTVESVAGSLNIRYETELGARPDSLKVGNPVDRFHDWFTRLNGPVVDGLPPFWRGAVGFFGYESARHLDPKLTNVLKPRRTKSPTVLDRFPEFEFSIYDAVAVVDHARRRLWLIHTVLLPEGKKPAPLQLEKIYRAAQDRLRRYAVQLQKAVRNPTPWGQFRSANVRSNRSAAAYQLMVRRAKGLIGAGELYQCNLAQTFSGSWEGDPWSLYRQLTAINPSPYAALWRSGQRWMVSASPELLLRQEAGRVETRPIAGTYPRNPQGSEDQSVLRSLVEDAKERAEHIMLVDLERNDLGRVCTPGSVQVAESLTVETYSHVFHLVSDIRGTLEAGRTWRDVLQAGFPGGTITGCPKIRCMEAIQRLEAQRRGPYCGSLGWIGFSGDMTLNILIRTLFLDKNRLAFPAGAGIVADSNPAREYQETLHKAQALLSALKPEGPRSLRRPQ